MNVDFSVSVIVSKVVSVIVSVSVSVSVYVIGNAVVGMCVTVRACGV